MKNVPPPTWSPQDPDENRLLRIHQLIDRCIERRLAGEDVSDDDLIAEHPDLLPELADELSHLAVIERARRRVAGSSQLEPLDGLRTGASPLASDVFTGYDIIDEIHRGGQGVVYRALHRSTNRTVALKVMREGAFAGPRELARFEREIDVLSRLEHPNIVRIHDRGVTAGGSFYYVMDYIDGPTIDQFVHRVTTDKPVTIDDVLDLALKTCDAVQAAHQIGVIHRDIKPSNIRVNRDSEPFVLDFGLAKERGVAGIEDEPGAGPTAMTITGQFVGSVPWASPEQASGTTDIDVRTDVYALGLLIYHMLTGKFPYDVEGDVRGVLDRIVRDEPKRIRPLRPRVSDELETIVLRCLAKERDRRYESAGALARDIRRLRAGEPIEAKRASKAYMLRKTLARHRVAFTVTAAFFLLITTAAIWLAQLYAGQRTERLRAESAASNATRQANRAEAIYKMLENMIASANPDEAKGADYTLHELLNDFAATLDEQDIDDPAVLATIHFAIGKSYRGLGMFEKALEHISQSLEIRREIYDPPHIDLALSINDYAVNLNEMSRYEEALAMYREAHDMFLQIESKDDMRSLKAQSNIASCLFQMGRYDEAEPLFAEILQRCRERENARQEIPTFLCNMAHMASHRGDLEGGEQYATEALEIAEQEFTAPHPQIVAVMQVLATQYVNSGKYVQARELLNRALNMADELFDEEHPMVAGLVSLLAEVAVRQGKLEEALELRRKSLAIARKVYPAPSNKVAVELGTMVSILARLERPDEAAPLAEEAVALAREIHGEVHYNVGASLNVLGQVRIVQGRYKEAEQAFRESLKILTEVLGAENVSIAILINNLAMSLSKQDRDAEAAKLYAESLELSRRVLPEDHPNIGPPLTHLAEALKFSGDYEASEPIYKEALEFRRRVDGNDSIFVAYTLNGFGDLYLEMREFAKAEPLYRESLDISTAGLPVGHPNRAIPFVNLGRALTELGRHTEAEPYLRRGLDIRTATRSPDHADVAVAEHWMGMCLIRQSRFEEALPFLEDDLRIRSENERETPWRVARAQASVAQALMGLDQLGRAEELLTEAYPLAEDDPRAANYTVKEIADLLVKLYTQLEDEEQAQHWREVSAGIDPTITTQ